MERRLSTSSGSLWKKSLRQSFQRKLWTPSSSSFKRETSSKARTANRKRQNGRNIGSAAICCTSGSTLSIPHDCLTILVLGYGSSSRRHSLFFRQVLFCSR